MHSELYAPDAPCLASLVGAALDALRAGEIPERCGALRDLSVYLDELDEASYHRKNRMTNQALRAELLPWVELCDLWLDASRRGVRALLALAHHKRYAGRVLEPFNRYVLEAGVAEESQAALRLPALLAGQLP